MIDTTVIGATNLSGKGLRLQLMDASAFIPVPIISTFEVILGVIGVLMVLSGLGSFDVSLAGWGLIISGIPAYKLWRMQKARSERRELNGYIGEVFG